MSEAAKVRHIGAGGGGFYLPTCDVAFCGVRRQPGVTIVATGGNCPECVAQKALAMSRLPTRAHLLARHSRTRQSPP
jgi:hypothetical protein